MAFEGSREKLGIIGELWAFMRVRKKWWLGPIVVMLALLGLLVVFRGDCSYCLPLGMLHKVKFLSATKL